VDDAFLKTSCSYGSCEPGQRPYLEFKTAPKTRRRPPIHYLLAPGFWPWLLLQPCPFELKPLRKVRILLGLASNTLAKEDAVERDHLRSAIGNCREPYLYGLRRV
jgi:hypothetical protein